MREVLSLPTGMFLVFGAICVMAGAANSIPGERHPLHYYENVLGSAFHYTMLVRDVAPGFLMIALGLIILQLAVISGRLRRLAKSQGKLA